MKTSAFRTPSHVGFVLLFICAFLTSVLRISPAWANDSIATALPVAKSGQIGDGSFGTRDVDIYRFSAVSGQTVTVNVDVSSVAGSALNSVVRLFNQAGTQLAINDGAGLDSALQFTLTQTGVYYVGVSGSPNSSYNPLLAGSGVASSTGNYNLRIALSSATKSEPNDTLATSDPLILSPSVRLTRTGQIGDGVNAAKDVDMFNFFGFAGQVVTIDVDARSLSPVSGLDSVVRLFRSDGTQLAANDDATDPIFGNGRDSYLQFVLPVNGTYYIGVSGYPNGVTSTYNPTVSGSGVASNTTGLYSLHVELAPPTGLVDLAVAQTQARNPVDFQTNPNVTYVITAVNNGPSTANSVFLTDIVPPNATYLSSSANPPIESCSVNGNGTAVTCFLGSIAAAAAVQITMNFQLLASSPSNRTNEVVITSSESDMNLENNVNRYAATVLDISPLYYNFCGDPNSPSSPCEPHEIVEFGPVAPAASRVVDFKIFGLQNVGNWTMTPSGPFTVVYTETKSDHVLASIKFAPSLPTSSGQKRIENVLRINFDGGDPMDRTMIGTTQRGVKPSQVVNLTATSNTLTSVDLQWTAPGDDTNNGTVTGYQIRYAPTAITDETKWTAATVANQVSYNPATLLSGGTPNQKATIAGLACGTTYHLAIKGIDEAGNEAVVSNSAVRSTAVCPPDTTPPVAGTVTATNTAFGTFVDSPFDLVTTFTDSQSPVASCQYTIDGGGTWLAATVSGSLPTFTCTKTAIAGSNGQSLTLNMRATSTGGTGTGAAISRTVDTGPPTTTDNAPTGWVGTDRIITLTPSDGTGSGVAKTEYCTDTTNSCTPSTTGTSVSVTCPTGAICQTYVRYRSTDNVDNAETVKSALVMIDKAAPDTSITSGPATSTSNTTATFNFSSTEPNSTFQCKLDSAAFAACTSPQSYTGLSIGGHTFQVRATDQANNTEPTPASYNWTIQNGLAATISLTYEGKQRDKVGQGDAARNADGSLDGVFTVTLSPGSDNRNVTRLELRNTAIPGGVWNTQSGDGSWTLGAASGLDNPLLNAGDDSVNFVVSEGGNFKIFAADYEGRMFGHGVKFTLTAEFGDGTSASDSVRLPVLDFDGDGKSDIGIYRDGTWIIVRSSGGANIVESLGTLEDIPVPADYDGDGKADIAIYKTKGEWEIKRSSNGQVIKVGFGGPSFTPVPADYDGDGKADVAVYLDGGVWSILRSSDGGNTVVAHGGPGWTAVPADYDGDGKTDIAVEIDGAWSILRSSDAGNPKVPIVVPHGGPPWTPVPADYDGDGKADVAVYMNGAWSIIESSKSAIEVHGHGGSSAQPLPADYDGDGKADIAVYFPDGASAGAWSIKRSSDNGLNSVAHGGGPQDVPLN